MALPDSIAVRTDAPPGFLTACLREWPASHALLRAIELRKLWRYPLDVEVFIKAVEFALLHREFYVPKDFEKADWALLTLSMNPRG